MLIVTRFLMSLYDPFVLLAFQIVLGYSLDACTLHRSYALFLQILFDFVIVDAVHGNCPPQLLKLFINLSGSRSIVIEEDFLFVAYGLVMYPMLLFSCFKTLS